MLVGDLDDFFGEVSIHVFCPFLHWTVCVLGVEFEKFFLDLDTTPLSDMSFANIFSHSVGCLLVLLTVPSLCRSFLFDEVPVVHFCFCFPCLWRRVE